MATGNDEAGMHGILDEILAEGKGEAGSGGDRVDTVNTSKPATTNDNSTDNSSDGAGVHAVQQPASTPHRGKARGVDSSSPSGQPEQKKLNIGGIAAGGVASSDDPQVGWTMEERRREISSLASLVQQRGIQIGALEQLFEQNGKALEQRREGVKALDQALQQALQQGREALEQMSEGERNYSGLVEGTSKLTIGRAFMIGGARKGKSATTDSILNNDYTPGPSTQGVAIYNTACYIWADSGGDLQIIPVESRRQQLFLMSGHAVRAAPSTPLVDGGERAALRKVGVEMARELTDMFSLLLHMPSAFIEFWDTAGQLPYQALHTTFLRSERTVYLMAFDVNDKLDDPYLDVTTQDSGHDIPPPLRVGLTNFDVINEWLHTVFDSVSAGEKPTVFLVGTHCDEVEEAVTTECRDEIWKRISEKPYRSLFTRQRDSSFFFVNNTKSGKPSEDQDEGIRQLRTAVLNTIQSSCEQLEPVPNRWLPFTAFVNQMSGNDSKIIKYDVLEELANEGFGIGDEEFDAMLRFHDNLGYILLSSDDSSRSGKAQHVVMDVRWLTSAAGVLLAACPVNSERALCDKKMYDDFSSGVVSEEFAVFRWDKSTDPAIKGLALNREDRSVFFRLMVKYCLAFEVPESSAEATAAAPVEVQNESQPPWRKFLFPCVVTAEPPDSTSESPPILLRLPPDRGCVQRRHFASLVTKCLQVLKPDEWVLGSSVVELRYKNDFWLQLRYNQESIVIHLEIDESPETKAKLLKECNNVVRMLDNWMNTTRPAPNLDYFAICECQPANSSTSLYTLVSGDIGKFLRCPHDGESRRSKPAVVSQSVIDCWLKHICQGKVDDFKRHTSKTERYSSYGSDLGGASNYGSQPTNRTSETAGRPTDPWKDERYVGTTYDLQCRLTEINDVRGLCFAKQLIDRRTKDVLRLIKIESDHNEELLAKLEATGQAVFFGKFREIIRHLSQQRGGVFDDILQVWDSIHPPPEEYLDLKNSLARSH